MWCFQRPVRDSISLAGNVQDRSLLVVDQVELLLHSFDVCPDCASGHLGVSTSDNLFSVLVGSYVCIRFLDLLKLYSSCHLLRRLYVDGLKYS